MPITVAGPDHVILNGTAFKVVESRLQVQDLGTFPRKITIGDPTIDSQDFLSTWAISDLSGGHGLQEHSTDATVSRYRYSTMDVTRPKMWTQRPKVNTETGTSAAFMALGDLLYSGNIEMYSAFGTDLHIWNESTDAWTDTTTNLAAAPVNTGVAFAGTGTLRLFIPLGSTGYDTYTGAVHASATASGSVPAAKKFVVFSQMLICLDTSNQLWWSTDGSAWTSFGADGKVDASLTANDIVEYRDNTENPTILIATNGGIWVFDPGGPTLYRQDLQFPRHPDQGLATEVWRGVSYTSAGMGMHSWNSATGTIDAMGLDRDEGLPYLYGYNSRIVSIAGAYNEMYALVQGSTSDSTRPSVHKWTGRGWHAVWEASGTGAASKLYVSNARSTYRLWWGVGNNSYTIELPRAFTNPKQMSYNLSANLLDTTGNIETGLSDMGMPGYRKIAHSARVRIAYLNAASGSTAPTLHYRLRDEDAYTEVYRWTQVFAAGGIAVPYETFHFGFGANGTDATGVGFDEIELKLTIPDQYAIVKFLAMDFMKIPKQNRSWTMTFDLSGSFDDTSPATMASTLDALIISETVTKLIHRGSTYWVRLASWNGQDNLGKGDDRGMRTVQVIETRFVTNEAGAYLT